MGYPHVIISIVFDLELWPIKGTGRKEVKRMKQAIHPNYKLTKVSCACGNEFETGSVKENLRVEVCSECHPFYTGKQKFLDAGGRVDKFKKKYGI